MGRCLLTLAALALLAGSAGAQRAVPRLRQAPTATADTLGAAARPDRTVPAVTPRDSLSSPVDTAGAAAAGTVAPEDSAAARVPTDPFLAWTIWPDIGPAIALEPLDGPADILEKEEIIADRIDALRREDSRLDTVATTRRDLSLALAAQLEVLDDLADLQLDGDLESQQRLDAARQDLLESQRLAARIDAARTALAQRLATLHALALDYRQRAAQLRAREERR